MTRRLTPFLRSAVAKLWRRTCGWAFRLSMPAFAIKLASRIWNVRTLNRPAGPGKTNPSRRSPIHSWRTTNSLLLIGTFRSRSPFPLLTEMIRRSRSTSCTVRSHSSDTRGPARSPVLIMAKSRHAASCLIGLPAASAADLARRRSASVSEEVRMTGNRFDIRPSINYHRNLRFFVAPFMEKAHKISEPLNLTSPTGVGIVIVIRWHAQRTYHATRARGIIHPSHGSRRDFTISCASRSG